MEGDTPWIKMGIIFAVLMLMVWKFNIGISLNWKLVFTVALAVGIYLKLGMG